MFSPTISVNLSHLCFVKIQTRYKWHKQNTNKIQMAQIQLSTLRSALPLGSSKNSKLFAPYHFGKLSHSSIAYHLGKLLAFAQYLRYFLDKASASFFPKSLRRRRLMPHRGISLAVGRHTRNPFSFSKKRNPRIEYFISYNDKTLYSILYTGRAEY